MVLKRNPEACEYPNINFISVNNRNCNGCQTFDKDIMVTFTTPKEGIKENFIDIFLDKKQAESLVVKLSQVLYEM